METVRFLYIILFFSFVITIPLNAQEEKIVDFNKIESKDGLSSPNIRKILRDKYGFVWFGTQEGLSRFNGHSFINYSSYSNSPKNDLISSDVFDLTIDSSKENLWVLTTYGGLNKIDLKSGSITAKFPLQNKIKNNPSCWFTKMCLLNNNLYIGTNEGYLLIFDIEQLKIRKIIRIPSQSAGKSNIEAVASNNETIFIFLNNGKIIEYEPKTMKVLNSLTISSYNGREIHFKEVRLINDNIFLLATTEGLKTINSKPLQYCQTPFFLQNLPNDFSSNPIYSLSTSDEKIVVSGLKGLYEINANTGYFSKIVAAGNQEYNDWIFPATAIEKIDNSLLLGSPLGVAFIKNIESPFTKYTESRYDNYAKIKHSIHLTPLSDSILYSGANEGLYRINLFKGIIKKIGKSETYFTAFKAPGGLLFASRVSGTEIILADNEHLPVGNIFPELASLNNDAIISYACYRDSLYFMASENQNGLYIWDYPQKKVTLINTSTSKIKLASNVINRLYNNGDDKIWIVGDDHLSVYNISKKEIEHISLSKDSSGSPLSLMMDICENKNNKFIAAYGVGIVALDSKNKIVRIYDTKDGVKNLGLYKIFPIGDSAIIASSNDGLALLNLNTGKASMFYEEDGLQSNSFEETSGNTSGRYIYLGGINGFTRIDPSKFKSNSTPPSLFFSEIKSLRINNAICDTFNLFIEKFYIPNDATQTTVSFVAVNYSAPHKITYVYKIKELHKTFLPLGNQNFINLVGLSPGTYTLQVKAANEDGIWCKPKTLTLIFEPRWYQSFWFQLFQFLGLLTFIYGVYRFRLLQLKREESIRTRIAADLHDDIGSTLTSVRIFTDLGLAKNSTEYFPQIRAGIQEASTSLRDIIWVLDKTNNNAKQLLERVAKFALPLTVARQINFRLIEEDGLEHIELGTELRRDLYLVAKEFITNSLKYSDCQHITLTATKQKKRLHILLKDDGIGFDPSTITRGNGLNNMVRRASKAGYTTKLISKPGKGSSLELS